MRVHQFIIKSNIHRGDLIVISAKSSRFVSDIKIEYTHEDIDYVVDVKSLLGMLMLPIKMGTTIRLVTKGEDEEEALEFVCNLFEKKHL